MKATPTAAAAPLARLELVDELVRQLEARFGPGIIYRLSRARPKVGAVVLSSGSLGLDRASGIGGVPRGRFTVLRGGESSGKTTLAYHLLAEAQRDGGLAALIDGEGSADPVAMRACGVDLDDLILASPRDAVEALEMVEILVRCRALDAVVASTLPFASTGLLDHGLRRLNAWLKDAPTALVFVATGAALAGRTRSRRPGWEGLSSWGGRLRGLGLAGYRVGPHPDPLPCAGEGREVAGEGRGTGEGSGAWARGEAAVGPSHDPLDFYASLVVELRLARPLFGPGGDLVGLRVRALVAKNRLAAPGGWAELELLEGRGLRRAAEALELGLALGLVERLPQGLAWGRVLLGRGPAAALAELESDPELAAELVEAIRAEKD